MKDTRNAALTLVAVALAASALVVAILAATALDDRGAARAAGGDASAASVQRQVAALSASIGRLRGRRPGKTTPTNANAASATTSIGRSQREAVVFVANLKQGDAIQQAFYGFVEFGAAGIGTTMLSPVYNRVTTIQGAAATLPALKNALKAAAARSGIARVDLVFATHGLSGQVLLSDGFHTMTQVRDTINAGLTATERSRLRMVFSTACFGSTHLSNWIGAGFDVASGSKLIYADSVTSYPAFLGAWVAGSSFSGAVNAANLADPAHVSDGAAKLLLGRTDVDSTRVISGNGALNINS